MRRPLTILLALLLIGVSSLTAAAPAAAEDPIYCPRHDREDRFDANRVEDKRLKRARRIARRHDCIVRVVRRDGEDLTITDDLRYDRINVVVRNHRVKRVAGVY